MLIKNLSIIIVFYFFIIFSSIGYGKILSDKLLKKNLDDGYNGLFGLFFLIIYSYISNIFFAHNIIHNLILLTPGFFFYFFLKRDQKSFLFNFSLFSILFIALVIFKTHDDFPYYHFPYTYHLTQTNLMFGIGNFNHGFRTPSSIFYLNSLFYLPYLNFFFFHMGAILIMGFVNSILIKKVYDFRSQKVDFLFYLSLLSIIFINIFFYRIGEHGTDRSAQILVLLFAIELFVLLKIKKLDQILSSKILVLVGLIISLKAFYVMYLSYLGIIFIFFLKFFDFKRIILFLKNLVFFYFFLILLFLVIFTYFVNTGCFLYPVEITCLDTSWSIPSSEVIQMNNWYEQWSKGGAGPNFRVDNPAEYIQNFNWIINWIDVYFFNKVSDFLLSLVLLSLIFFLLFLSTKKNRIILKREYLFLYILTFILFFEWFYNHPALRYGGYVLICLLIFIPISFILSRNHHNKKSLFLRTKCLLILCLIIFVGRNLDRINNEIVKYNFTPFLDNSFRISDNHFRIKKKIDELIKNYEFCKEQVNFCEKNASFQVYKKNNIYFFSRN